MIVSQIKKYVPLIRPFFDMDMTLSEYSRRLYDFEVAPLHRQRQELVKNKIREKFVKLFGPDAAKNLWLNFGEKLAFGIADHHQVMSHPFLISANIVSSADKFFQAAKPDAIVVISSGDVPPNNYFSRNGLVFHDKRVPIFSVSEREFTSYYIPKRNFNLTERLKKAGRWNQFDNKEQEFLAEHEKTVRSQDFSRCQNYIDQISVIVRATWPLLFEQKMRANLPELLYCTQEELITECLIELLREDNFVSRAVFEPSLRQRVLDNFRGIVVAWRENEGKGTHFFWRKYPGQPRSLRMYVNGNKLVPVDSRFADLAVPLEREIIIDLLKKREIYPSLFMIFSVLNFYAGVRPLTGFGSVVYLELFKQAWLKTLKGTEFENEIPIMNDISTAGMNCGIVLFFERIKGKLKALYAHDIFYNGGIREEYMRQMLDRKFNELFEVGVADMYDYFRQKYIPKAEQIDKKINFNDMAEIVFASIK